jgi:hypothetical protein
MENRALYFRYTNAPSPEFTPMRTLQAKILSILQLRPSRRGGQLKGQSANPVNCWRMRVSYDGPETLYEIKLREPLRSMASKRHTVGLNGMVEFEMLSNPGIAAGDSILIDAYEPGERIFGGEIS